MGCACKAEKRLNKELFNNNFNNNERKGFIGFINKYSITFLNKFMITLLLIILTPIVLLVLLYNFLIGDRLVIETPKFIINYINKHKNE